MHNGPTALRPPFEAYDFQRAVRHYALVLKFDCTVQAECNYALP